MLGECHKKPKDTAAYHGELRRQYRHRLDNAVSLGAPSPLSHVGALRAVGASPRRVVGPVNKQAARGSESTSTSLRPRTTSPTDIICHPTTGVARKSLRRWETLILSA
jgi:hypothetical protein